MIKNELFIENGEIVQITTDNLGKHPKRVLENPMVLSAELHYAALYRQIKCRTKSMESLTDLGERLKNNEHIIYEFGVEDLKEIRKRSGETFVSFQTGL